MACDEITVAMTPTRKSFPNGPPVPGVEIEVFIGSTSSGRFVTDANGHYESGVSELRTKTQCSLMASKEGFRFVPGNPTFWHLGLPGEEFHRIDFLALRHTPSPTPPTPTSPPGPPTAPPTTATPAPEMLRNVNVFGIVVARETPVRARILLHPSDGRCPWSDGYRSGEDGRLDRTCSDARQGSNIDVWVLGDHHDPWSQWYEVQRGDHGAKPIEVRAILTARPASASPTPTPVDQIGETRWFGNVVVRGGGPVPWASVAVDADDSQGRRVRCLSPVNTDDAGHFEVWCFGGHSVFAVFRIAVRASGCEPWEPPSWRVSNGGIPLGDIELVCATSTPAATGTPPTPSATATPGDGQGGPSPMWSCERGSADEVCSSVPGTTALLRHS